MTLNRDAAFRLKVNVDGANQITAFNRNLKGLETTAQSDLGNLSYSDQDGVQMLNMPFIAVPTSSGNDELSIAFT